MFIEPLGEEEEEEDEEKETIPAVLGLFSAGEVEVEVCCSVELSVDKSFLFILIDISAPKFQKKVPGGPGVDSPAE
jgi:hypothetical protein